MRRLRTAPFLVTEYLGKLRVSDKNQIGRLEKGKRTRGILVGGWSWFSCAERQLAYVRMSSTNKAAKPTSWATSVKQAPRLIVRFSCPGQEESLSKTQETKERKVLRM